MVPLYRARFPLVALAGPWTMLDASTPESWITLPDVPLNVATLPFTDDAGPVTSQLEEVAPPPPRSPIFPAGTNTLLAVVFREVAPPLTNRTHLNATLVVIGAS